MNIMDEFRRLETLTQTDEGWSKVEEAWMIATNHYKDGDLWLCRGASKGNQVTGFAIDPETMRYNIETKGSNHSAPYDYLVGKLIQEGLDIDEAEYRVLKGSLAHLEGWKYPFLLIYGMDIPNLEQLESFVLKQEIALPVRKLFNVICSRQDTKK